MDVLPAQVRSWAPAAVVAAEVVLAAALAIGSLAAFLPGFARLSAVGFIASASLLAMLTVVVVLSIRRGISRPCRCFGTGEAPLGWADVIRNAALIAVAMAGLLASTGGEAHGPAAEIPGALIAAVAGLVTAAIAIHFEDLVDLFAPAGAGPGSR